MSFENFLFSVYSGIAFHADFTTGLTRTLASTYA